MPIRTYVLNGTQALMPVPIQNAEGQTDEIYVVPGGRPYLQDGWFVPEEFLVNNPRIRVDHVEMEGDV